MPAIDAVIAAAIDGNAKLVFLCSPSNPGGRSVPLAQVVQVATALAGRALVVVDEAYGEFADEPSAVSLMAEYANIAVLRTLSKAHGLAAARIGSLIADPALVAVLRKVQAPYPIRPRAVRWPWPASPLRHFRSPHSGWRRCAASAPACSRHWPRCRSCAGCMPPMPTSCWPASMMRRAPSMRCWPPASWCVTNARLHNWVMRCALP
jgi:Histidinol-phosphate/aromatic aminotransferase and cobyric acid decarboxylase